MRSNFKHIKKTKLKAFTLSEMLVVLVVASIVISMGFLVLNMVRKQVQSIQKNYQKKQTVQFFESTLTRDLNTRSVVYYDKLDELVLKNTNDSIRYQFLDSIVVREKDTFAITIDNKKLFLNGTQVTNKTIDAIEINLSKGFYNKQLFIQQTKDAAYYINN